MELQRILVALDGSKREEHVLAVAQDLAVRYATDLILLRVVGLPPEIPPDAWQNPALTVKEFLEKKARIALEAREKALPAAVRSRTLIEVVVATPWQGICLCAQAQTADLIVIGSHGYGALDRFLGTTAAQVANHAPCSVFVVRSPGDKPAPLKG
jgi:nucleotide-binding universal stress UspA family protein